MSIDRYLAGLRARYDSLALRPPAAAADEATRLQGQAAVAQALTGWCQAGAGPGHCSPWQPGARPAVGVRLSAAALRGPHGPHGQDGATTAWANALGRQIDGGTRLDALPGNAGRRWRLQIKLAEAAWWRPRQSADPWDVGWAINTPPALRQMLGVWMPRRATLILADAAEFDALAPSLGRLWQRQDDFRHPVRWLWVGGAVDVPARPGLPLQRFTLA